MSTVLVATGLLYYRKQSWKDLGLTKPKNYLKTLGIAGMILVATVISMIVFELFFKDLLFSSETEVTESGARFKEVKGSISFFFSIIVWVWIESFLEELQDRGFSLNRFQSLFSKIPLANILAVLFQAAIFGFRHSYDFSPRSVTTAIIGFVFGLIYVLTGRNLWPLIIAHIILNTMSMIDRI